LVQPDDALSAAAIPTSAIAAAMINNHAMTTLQNLIAEEFVPCSPTVKYALFGNP
jgi:hypothetical protein